ncbi:MAG: hypothetical protein R6V55_01045 [Desulfovermiculus sp.]
MQDVLRFEWLREQAEQLIKENPDHDSGQSSEMMDVIHEFKVAQAELEIQNQELRRSQQENAQYFRCWVLDFGEWASVYRTWLARQAEYRNEI